ncbi:DUF2129 domain-containing protein [Atopobacter sp. AH10]|nr:DUF2129 domain-containing protein [Atopobacter sp. AH10]
MIVYLYTLKKINQLKRYGYIHYVSKRMKYAIMYLDSHTTAQTLSSLERLHFVRSVDVSTRKEIETKDFSKILHEVKDLGKTENSPNSQGEVPCE